MSVGGANSRKTGRSSTGGDILISAKKRARQSEYARRRSRAITRDSIGAAFSQGEIGVQ
jgi:hypothetical protein